MPVGLTDLGFVARRQPEIRAAIEERLAGDPIVGGYNFRDGPLEQLIGVLSELLAEQWEAMEATYAAAYGGAAGISLDRVSELTGTTRRAATRSTVTGTVNLNAGVTLPAGSVAAVNGNPDAQFRTTAAVTNSGASAANVSASFESVEAGPVAAPAATLTEIVSAVSGWNSVTNALDADLGREVADDPELRTTRELELTGAGAANVDAIRAELLGLDGMISVTLYQNVTSAPVGGRPAKSIEAVVWDGSTMAVADDDIAQAIWDTVAAGIEVYGSSSGTAEDDTGATWAVSFSRATSLRLYVDLTVVLEPGTAAGWEDEVAEAINARAQEYAVGEVVYASQLECVVQDLPFIRAVTALDVDTSTPPSGASVTPTDTQIPRVATADVTPTT